jgi:hypothetical protein
MDRDVAPDPSHRIANIQHRIDSIRLALDATGASEDVREVLTAMLDAAERDLQEAAQVVLPPLLDVPSSDPGGEEREGRSGTPPRP